MLQTGADIFLLHAVYKGGADLSGEIRILGIIFEISSAERRAFHIDTRSEQDSNVLCLTFIAERIADLMNQIAVEGVRQGCCCWKSNGKNALGPSHIIDDLLLLAQSVRSVGNHDCL